MTAGAGKTTILTLLCGQGISDIKPTTGFEIKAAQFKRFILNIKEIGGTYVCVFSRIVCPCFNLSIVLQS